MSPRLSGPYDMVVMTIKAEPDQPTQAQLQDALFGLRQGRHLLPGYGEETARLWNWVEAALAWAAGEKHWANDDMEKLMIHGQRERMRLLQAQQLEVFLSRQADTCVDAPGPVT